MAHPPPDGRRISAAEPSSDSWTDSAKYAHDHWGFEFGSVDAFNEPNSNWWTLEVCTVLVGNRTENLLPCKYVLA